MVPTAVRSVDVMRRAGLVPLSRPDHVLKSAMAVRKYGPIAGAARVAATRDSKAIGLVDELGSLTFRQLDLRSNALAHALAANGVNEHSVVALLARDHRGAVETMLATGKLGARLLLMNTGFARPQLVDVANREGVTVFVADQEFTDLVSALPEEMPRFTAWVDDPKTAGKTLEQLITESDDGPLPAPSEPGGMVLLTSGTTGTPKGAPRQVRSPLAAAQFLDRIPLRAGEATVMGAPLFHATGLSQFIISFALHSAVVVRRRFDPESTLRMIEDNRATAMVLVPTMLQRIMDLGPDILSKYDTSTLRIVFTAGSALSPELGNRASKVFGDVIHNLYGSTEVSVVTVATPADWRAAPGTVGKPPVGCKVVLYDNEGNAITEPEVTGRVFAGSGLAFAGYTDGRHKEIIDGLLSTGDVGHWDSEGRLFIDGRDDDMIVSGGENVFPAEIENLLVEYPGVVEAAVLGVDDEKFGQRLKAYVVLEEGAKTTEDDLREHVKDNLARFKVPRDVVFLEELPRNATGKLLRKRLPEFG
ncbi:acyl-CoA synthetase [Actinokineospora sp. G85]|uniref:acyl-CoA synthetase n=1 Tax=Actinokineospora sp. G85 TaxID=3406626 RepID=UPI003C735B61